MVTPRKFTGPEWRDLARGCRGLVKLDKENYERHKRTTIADRFLESKRLHEELVELCEHWGKQADLVEFEASKAAIKKTRQSEGSSPPVLDAKAGKSKRNKILPFRRGPS